MHNSVKKLARKAGQPPGILLHTGDFRNSKTTISVLDYDEHSFQEIAINSVDQLAAFKTSSKVTWINISGLDQISIIDKLGSQFGLHPLVLEDILSTAQRPKIELYDDYTYIVLKMVYYSDPQNDFTIEQVSLIVSSNYVITFHETSNPLLKSLWQLIISGKWRVRQHGADYLAYAIIDTIVDNYFVILETIGEQIESLEDELLERPEPKNVQRIYGFKSKMLLLRRLIWPVREIIISLERGQSAFFTDATLFYIRDVYDHTIQLIETIESFRDMIAGMFDIYLSSVSNKVSEVMKVLTIISTIFMPLTFIAGVYGMNFEYMPELKVEWGYPVIMAVMGAIACSMIIYFKTQKWL